MVDATKSSLSSQWDLGEITFGGERVSPQWQNDCYFAHLSIYYFASRFCQDKLILDAGSGTGYGAAYLADRGAKFVQAIDISETSVAFSRYYFERPNLQFRAMDLQGISELPEQEFDVIFSSNVLEHVPDVSAFLHVAWKLVKPEGVLIVAVPPLVDEASRKADLGNPYHLNSWSPRQWYHALNLFFADIQSYRHGFERPDVVLDFGNTPEQTTIDEKDFLFEPVSVEQLYHVHTLTAIFTARKPRPGSQVPVLGTPMSFVDESFTRPFVAPSPARDRPSGLGTNTVSPSGPKSLFTRAWAIKNAEGWRSLLHRSVTFFWLRTVKRS